MLNETKKRIEEEIKESWNSKDWKLGFRVGAKRYHDIGYNQAIEDAIEHVRKSFQGSINKAEVIEELQSLKQNP